MRITEDALWERLETANEMEPSEARLELVREVVGHAEGAELWDILVEARLMLFDARLEWSHAAADAYDLLTIFVRCVSLYTRMPERFSEDHVSNLWRGLGIVGIIMIEMADRPVEQIRAVLEDMAGRCRPDRNDMHTIQLLRMRLEARIGNVAAADEAMRQARMLDPADYMVADAAAVEIVDRLAELGRDEEAIDAMSPVLSGQIPVDDGTDPLDHLDVLLLPYLRTGRLEEAREAHRRTYRRRGALVLSAHLEFCARSGNEERGREVLLRNLEEFADAPDTWRGMREAAAAALLCRRLIELGRGEESWTWPADAEAGTRAGEVWTYAQLYDLLAGGATGFAGKLDSCNQTKYQSSRVHALIHARPIVDYLPLSPVEQARTQLAHPGTQQLSQQVPAPATVDPAALLDDAERAQQLAQWARFDRAVDEYATATGGAPPDELSAARMAELRAFSAEGRQEQEALSREAAERYGRLGYHARAHVCLGRLGMWLCSRDGDIQAGMPLVTAALAELRTVGDPYQVAGTQLGLASAALAAVDHSAALAALTEVERAMADGADDPQRAAVLRGRAASQRAQLLLSSDQAYEAVTAAGIAADAYREAGHGHGYAEAWLLQGGVARALGDPETALRAYAEAASAAGPGTPQSAVARAIRGEMLLEEGKADDAVPELVEAVAALTALGDPRAAYARVDLATAYRCFDRWVDAAECAEEAIPVLDAREEDLELAMQARWILAQSYEGLGQPADAVRVLDEMLETEQRDSSVGLLHKQVAGILSDVDMDGEAVDRYLAAAEAYSRADSPLDEVYCRRNAALSLRWAGRTDEALAVGEQVQHLLDRVPANTEDGVRERAIWSYDYARVLTGAEDPNAMHAAVDHALAATAGFQELGRPDWAGAAHLLAAQILHLDEPERAAEQAQRALAVLPEDSADHAEATELLAREW